MEYKIKMNAFKEIKKKMIFTSILKSLVTFSVGIYIVTVNMKTEKNDINVLPYVIPLLLLPLGFGIFIGIKRQKKLIESYRLIINEESIVREQFNTSEIAIPIHQISTITKHKNGTITIQGKDKTDTIAIPVQIENYNEILKKIAVFTPIKEIEKENYLQKYSGILTFFTIGLMFCVYALKNKIIVGVSGVLLILFLIYSFIAIGKSKNIDNQSKKIRWMLLIVLVSIVGVMTLKLTGKF
jgi:hypothetical protein